MRKPIYLNKNAVALINVFTRPDNIEDMWITDFSEYLECHKNVAEEAAKEFIDQLDERYTPRFLRALKKEINKRLEEDTFETKIGDPARLRFTDVLNDNIVKGA